jgi:lysophospholipid acyltransferase (LPLAT)-like uncharacterized protein
MTTGRTQAGGGGRTTPHPPTFGGRVAARAAWVTAYGIAATLRWRFTDRSGLFAPGSSQRAIFAVWHNRQLLAPGMYNRFFQNDPPGRRLAAMASASRDGAIAARILELFGAHAVRGSSSRRGAVALAELIDLARARYDLAVTPDGPRGPRYKVQAGTVVLAQYTGLPLVPVSLNLSRKKVLPSWDGFQIPLPFGRCEVIAGEALRVPRQLDDAGRTALVDELERRLLAITED